MQLRGNGETCGRVSEENNEQRRMGRDSYAPSRVSAYFRQMNLSYLIHRICINSRHQDCTSSNVLQHFHHAVACSLCSCPEKRVSYFSMSQTVHHCASADFLHNVKSLYASCTIGKLSVSIPAVEMKE